MMSLNSDKVLSAVIAALTIQIYAFFLSYFRILARSGEEVTAMGAPWLNIASVFPLWLAGQSEVG